MNLEYTPNKKNRAIVARAWEHVQSVDYSVSLRWLFYRLLQDGFYSKKKDYDNKFKALLKSCRKNFYQGWRPDTLVDDSRSSVVRGQGHLTPDEWVDALARYAACELSPWPWQAQYVELWYEARAMTAQFEHYTQDITLRPFGGDPSIPFKWEIAKALESAYEDYGLPIVVLYFGDLDEKGQSIMEAALADIRLWCGVDFDFLRAGLNPGDEHKYNIPENPDKPGEYQWEALDDHAARELITSSVSRFVDFSAMAEKRELERQVTRSFREHVRGFEVES